MVFMFVRVHEITVCVASVSCRVIGSTLVTYFVQGRLGELRLGYYMAKG